MYNSQDTIGGRRKKLAFLRQNSVSDLKVMLITHHVFKCPWWRPMTSPDPGHSSPDISILSQPQTTNWKWEKKINYPVNMFQFLLLILNDSPRSDVELYSVTVRLNQFEGLYLVGRRTRYWLKPTEARPPEGWVAFGCISSLFPRKSNQYNRLSALEQNVKQTSTARIQRRSALLLLASSQWTIAVAVIPIGQK